MKQNIRILLIDIITALYVFLFVYAALSKFIDFQKFEAELGKSPILTAYSKAIAWLVPSIELQISGLLMVRKFQLIALYFSFVLMAIFSAYIIAILKYSPYIPCSCGGILQNMSWGQHLIFNTCFLVIGCFAILIFPKGIKGLIAQ